MASETSSNSLPTTLNDGGSQEDNNDSANNGKEDNNNKSATESPADKTVLEDDLDDDLSEIAHKEEEARKIQGKGCKISISKHYSQNIFYPKLEKKRNAEERLQNSKMKEMLHNYPHLLQQSTVNGKNIESLFNEFRSFAHNFGVRTEMGDLVEFKNDATTKINKLEEFATTVGTRIEEITQENKDLSAENVRLNNTVQELTETVERKDRYLKKMIKDIQDKINPMKERIIEGN